MKNRTRLVTSILAVAALWLVPTVANAQTTISSVKVTVSSPLKTAVYCDTALTCPAGAVKVWNLAGGVNLAAGQTLVLSQTGAVPNTPNYGNFDTSDRVDALGGIRECTAGDPCAVAIEINGLPVYTSPVGLGDQLVTFNHDISGNGPFSEAQQYGANVVNQPSYTLALGYADNEHNLTCPGGACFPSPFGGTYTVGLSGSGVCSTNCFDAGALLITAKRVGPSCTVTQGGWGAPPHGNNPAAFLAANFPGGGVTIGGAFSLHFSTAQGVQNFLPQGGPPSFLNASALNPTTSSAGVFAGQVLALELNVTLKGDGGLVLFGTGTSLDGKTLTQVLAAANLALGGGALPAGFSYSSLNDLIDEINNAFDGCVATGWATAHLH